MEDIFIKILNMSITASYFALVLIIIRMLFKKVPKWLSCIMWGLVGLRLVFPFSFESMLSLVPSAETVPTDIMVSTQPHISSGISYINSSLNPIINEAFAPKLDESANPLQLIIPIISALWLIGIIVMLTYAFISYIILRKKTSISIETEKSIFICDRIDSPFILGIIRPKILIPSFISENDKNFILAHEKAHIKRYDHLWKPLGFIILSIHWFNPVMWLSYILLCRDIEGACDEKVIKEMEGTGKKAYSEALINCSAPKKYITACPLAFGETGVKQRIKNVLNYKKPAFWLVIVAVILSVLLSVFFLTDPTTSSINNIENYENIFRGVEKLQFYMPENFIYTTEDPGDELRVLKRIKINPEAISDDKEERKHLYKVKINGKTTVFFDENISKLWIEDNINMGIENSSDINIDENKEASLSYKIENPHILIKLFDKIQTPENPVLSAPTSPANTEYKGVYIEIKSIDKNHGGYYVLTMLWRNVTAKDVTYGDGYDIEIKNGDTWESVAKENIEFNNTFGYILAADSTELMKYTTQKFDISKIGRYRLIAEFSDEFGGIYKTSAEFHISNAGSDISEIGGVSGPDGVLKTKKMTLSDVKKLAEKGNTLSWEDFAAYSSVETSFGIFKKEYEINDLFYIEIGSEKPYTEPLYITLHCNAISNLYADMRNDNISEFIDKYKDAPIEKNISSTYSILKVEHNSEIHKIFQEFGGIPPRIALISVQALFTVKITSGDEFKSFIDEMDKITEPAEHTPPISSTVYYSDDYFDEHTLIAVYADDNSSETEFGVEYVTMSTVTEPLLGIGIRKSVSEVSDKNSTGTLIFISIKNSELKIVNHIYTIDAILSSTVYPEYTIKDSNHLRTYTFNDSIQGIRKPSFSLYENGWFVFNFSPYSNYFATGRYYEEDNTLLLRTNDGKYEYSFTKTNDTMVFDAENSSDNVHMSDVTDGSIFY